MKNSKGKNYSWLITPDIDSTTGYTETHLTFSSELMGLSKDSNILNSDRVYSYSCDLLGIMDIHAIREYISI